MAVNPEDVGRYLHGMILTDGDANASSPPGSFSVHGNVSSFVVEMDPDSSETTWEGVPVRVTVEVMQ